METLTYLAPCHFGLESVLSGELKRMGAEQVKADNGKVEFSGDFSILARANIELRTAERVMIKLGTFRAESFEDLFQGVKSIPLEDFIGKRDAFPVKGWSLNSKLHSIPDCQSIIKKAAVERLKSHYRQEWFSETGPVHQIRFSILKDEVTIMLDTSGVGLHKRGYRVKSNDAPIKETLAAGIIDLARVKPDSRVCDPFCGSGTFLIEAAMKALQIPPGLRRKFAAQDWGLFDESVWRQERARGLDRIRKDAAFSAVGSDLDPSCVALTKENAKKAGVLAKLSVRVMDVKQFRAEENLITFANPPYGERMLERKQAEQIYQTLGKVFRRMEGSSYSIISPHENFEKLFGKTADKRRKVYNGMMKCQVYQYFK
jgi:putative N6-adenine-specific DNA methylase